MRRGLLLVVGLLTGSCTSGTSTLTTPSTERCAVAAEASLPSVPAGGGNGTIAIHVDRDCAWTLRTDAPWIAVDGERQGQGAATVTYRVAANNAPAVRRANVAIGSAQLEIAQEAAPCQFSVDRRELDVSAAGAIVTLRTSAMSGCMWAAHSQTEWIAIAAGATGNGTADVALAVAANPGGDRQGSVVVAGTIVIVRQGGNRSTTPSPPAPSPSPSPSPPPPAPPAPSPTPPPPPAPSPTPSPPPPPPSPSPIGRIDLEGRLANLRGSCPTITFMLEGHAVYTDSSTDYRRGDCTHVQEGGSVEVRGQRYSDGRVRAERITVDRRD